MLRVLTWTALRRYRGLVRRPTWRVMIAAWNAAQDGRESWQIRNESVDVPKITYDYPPSGESGLRRPAPAGGINMPAARLRRLVGFDL